jgi:uncharacterized protein YjgD (DUF1641 family)
MAEELASLRGKIERVKREIAQNEGALETIMERVKKEFKVDTLDEAYGLLKKIQQQIEVKTEQVDDLLKTAREMLGRYHG